MKKIITSFLAFNCLCSFAQEEPQIFGEDIISSGMMDFNASFTDDMSRIFYSVSGPTWSNITICSSELVNGVWGEPEVLPFSGEYLDADPFLFEERQLFFISDRPVSDSDSYKKWNYKIWTVDVSKGQFGTPVLVDGPFNKNGTPLYPSLSENGNLYYTMSDSNNSNKFWVSRWDGHSYSNPEMLDFCVDGVRYIDAVVSKDEKFIVFSSDMPGGHGGVDLWVSFNRDGVWQEPVNLGATINSKGNDGQPGLSPDNNTLFYSYGGAASKPRKYSAYGELKKDLLSPGNGLLDIYHVSLPLEELLNQQ